MNALRHVARRIAWGFMVWASGAWFDAEYRRELWLEIDR